MIRKSSLAKKTAVKLYCILDQFNPQVRSLNRAGITKNKKTHAKIKGYHTFFLFSLILTSEPYHHTAKSDIKHRTDPEELDHINKINKLFNVCCLFWYFSKTLLL